jgi:hypothetical protein
MTVLKSPIFKELEQEERHSKELHGDKIYRDKLLAVISRDFFKNELSSKKAVDPKLQFMIEKESRPHLTNLSLADYSS